MVRDAEAHAEEDRQRKEEAEARNQADTLVYQAERMIREDAEANKLTADDKQRMEEGIAHLKDSLKGFDLAKVKVRHRGAHDRHPGRVRAPVRRRHGRGRRPTASGAGGGDGAGASNDDEVVDAEIVDEAR